MKILYSDFSSVIFNEAEKNDTEMTIIKMYSKISFDTQHAMDNPADDKPMIVFFTQKTRISIFWLKLEFIYKIKTDGFPLLSTT